MLRFIPHVGNAKGVAFDFPIAGIDDTGITFFEPPVEFGNIDGAIVFHASEGLRSILLGGEKGKTVFFHPLMNLLIELLVAMVTIFQTFFKDLFQLGAKGKNERDIGRAGGHTLFVIFEKFVKVKVVTAIF